jgi:hypothetical protein
MATILSIPTFSPQGVLPPYVGLPAALNGRSPYRITLLEFAQRFATSAPRVEILKGFMAHRARLVAAEIFGFQWLDGSFVEDIEKTESRDPSDVDVVTFHSRSPALLEQPVWDEFVKANLDVFQFERSKPLFKVDAYFVDFTAGPLWAVRMTAYWYGLFSHKRGTGLWKGMIEVPLDGAEDATVNQFLATR